MKVGRTVGGHHDQWYEGEVGFGDAGVKFGRRSTTGDHHDHRALRDQSSPEGKEPRTSFVESNVQRQTVGAGRSKDQWRRARSG